MTMYVQHDAGDDLPLKPSERPHGTLEKGIAMERAFAMDPRCLLAVAPLHSPALTLAHLPTCY